MPGLGMIETRRFTDAASFLDTHTADFLRTIYDAVLQVERPITQKAPDQKILLTLLTYCYARRIYSAAEIESRTYNDPVVRYICARHYPTAAQIRNFRRDHKELVTQALTLALAALSNQPASKSNRDALSRVHIAIRLDTFDLDD